MYKLCVLNFSPFNYILLLYFCDLIVLFHIFIWDFISFWHEHDIPNRKKKNAKETGVRAQSASEEKGI